MASLPDNIITQDTDIAKYLNDENGNVVYPVTKQRFVLDSEGNSLEGFVSDIDSRVSNLEESQGSVATPDWNENDSTSPSYIENRTHWEESNEVTESLTIDQINYTGDRGTSPSNCTLVFTLSNGTVLERLSSTSSSKIGWKIPGGWKSGTMDFGTTATFVNNECILTVGKPGSSASAPYTDTGTSLVPISDPSVLTRITQSTVVHKLDNKYLDLDSTPTSGSNKPVTSGAVYTSLSNTQPALVSGTNIKTINNMSLLGEGNISIEGGGGGDTSNCVKVDAQTFSTAQKTQARQNIGAGTSNFSGSYNDLTNKPTIPSITAMSTSEIDTIIANEDSN